MVELDENVQLPMVGPNFRIFLRSFTDRAGWHHYSLSIVNATTDTDKEITQSQEQNNEQFVAWVTNWFDISNEKWMEQAGVLKSKPESPCIELGLITSQIPGRHRGMYLIPTNEKCHGIDMYITGMLALEEDILGTWFAPVSESFIKAAFLAKSVNH